MKLENSMYIIFLGCLLTEIISGLMFGALGNIYYPFLNDKIPYSTICTSSINPMDVAHIIKSCKYTYYSNLDSDKKNLFELMFYAFIGVAFTLFAYGIYIWQRMIKQYRISLMNLKDNASNNL